MRAVCREGRVDCTSMDSTGVSSVLINFHHRLKETSGELAGQYALDQVSQRFGLRLLGVTLACWCGCSNAYAQERAHGHLARYCSLDSVFLAKWKGLSTRFC